MAQSFLWRDILTSPVPSLLNTNNGADATDTILIRNLADEVDHKVDVLEGRILEHMRSITKLIQEQEMLSAFKKDHLRHLRAFHRIPVEVWGEIFRLICAPTVEKRDDHTPPSYNYIDSFHPSNPVLMIRNVCADWREIIQNLPDIWCRVVLRQSCWWYSPRWPRLEEGEIESEPPLKGLSKYLIHCGMQPLHITLDAPTILYNSDESRFCLSVTEFVRRAVQLLSGHHQRWSSIYIRDNQRSLVTKAFTSSVISRCNRSFPSLEKAVFKWHPFQHIHDGFEPTSLITPFLQSLPHLRDVSFSCYCPGIDSIPWGQLTKVAFYEIKIEKYFPILSHLSTVEDMVLEPERNSAWDTPFIPPPESSFTLPCLKVLTLRGHHWGLETAKAPNLSSLTFMSASHEELSNTIPFISRSRCDLRHFNCTIDFIGETESHPTPALCDILSLSPHLEMLEAPYMAKPDSRWKDEEALLKFLMEESGKTLANCPNLRSLRIDPSYFQDVSLLKTTVEMIEMRRRKGPQLLGNGLRSVGNVDPCVFQNYDQFSEKIREPYGKLKAMREDGLDVRFFDDPWYHSYSGHGRSVCKFR